MTNHAMRLDTTPICMRCRHQQRLGRHPMMQQKHHITIEYKVFKSHH